MSEILEKRLRRAAEYRANKWGYEFTPDCDSELTSVIRAGIENIHQEGLVGDEFAISRAETGLWILVDE